MTEWQPIESAPKDGTEILLYRPSDCDWARVVVGLWEDDRYAVKPKPYWRHGKQHFTGIREARVYQPTHWMPLPGAPK